MADASNGNGHGNGDKRIEAIARNLALQGWARLSMVTGPPIIGALVAITGWFLAQLVGDVKATRELVTTYITADTAQSARTNAMLTEHDRRLGNLEGRVFGFSPPPRPQPTGANNP